MADNRAVAITPLSGATEMIRPTSSRAAGLVPLTAVCLVPLLGMVALCIDLTVVALGKTQCQNAADMAAMAAARTLDGNAATNNNSANAFVNGNTAATAATVLGQPVQASQVAIQIGTFTYDLTSASFLAANMTGQAAPGTSNPSYPPPAGMNWGLAQATINSNVNYSFARVFGMTSMPVIATAQAIHRPRDVAIIMDFSGSMAFDSYNARPQSGQPYSANPPWGSLNNDPRVPAFGHYDINTPYTANTSNPPANAAYLVNSNLPAPYAGNYVRTDDNELLKVGNQTYLTTSGPAIIEDFYTQSGSGSMIPAFIGGSATTPVTSYDGFNFPTAIPNWSGNLGDSPIHVNNTPTLNLLGTPTFSVASGTAYAKTVLEYCAPSLVSSTPSATVNVSPGIQQSLIETLGSSNNMYPSGMNGFTYGPGYYGKTFFIWPPVPDSTANPTVAVSTTATNATINDWRQRFFWAVRNDNSGKKRLDDNNILWQSNGAPRNPTSVYTDAAGLGWTWAPNYEAILYWIANTGPNPFPSNVRCGRLLYYASIPTTVANSSTDMDQLFWKQFIDYVTGFQGYSANGNGMNLLSGYGNDFTWTTTSSPTAVNPKPAQWQEIGQLNAAVTLGLAGGSPINVKTASYSTTSATMLNWVPPASTQLKLGSPTATQTYTVKSVTTTTAQWTLQLNEAIGLAVGSGQKIYASVTPSYMDYRDNPMRPKLRFWFGPTMFSDFLWSEYNTIWSYWRPGNCHEAPTWALKAGVQSALQDIQKNHPNDWVTTMYFSVPMGSSTDSNFAHRFNRVRGALGKSYPYMTSSLWYPPSVINPDGSLISLTAAGGEFRPYTSTWGVDSRYREGPYANGGTCPMIAFQQAYNQFSGSGTLRNADVGFPTGTAGGNGRNGARKLVIFETDGVPNASATSTFQNNGVNQSYYNCYLPSFYPNVTQLGNMDPSVLTGTYQIVAQLCDNATGTTGGSVAAYLGSSSTTPIARGTGNPGYSTNSKPVLVHSLAFGEIFESSSVLKPDCLGFLQSVQTLGNVQSSPTTPLASYKIIVGTSTQRVNSLKTAFTNIMQDGVQITLYK
jgi:Flp pilus assembly protein TadG